MERACTGASPKLVPLILESTTWEYNFQNEFRFILRKDKLYDRRFQLKIPRVRCDDLSTPSTLSIASAPLITRLPKLLARSVRFFVHSKQLPFSQPRFLNRTNALRLVTNSPDRISDTAAASVPRGAGEAGDKFSVAALERATPAKVLEFALLTAGVANALTGPSSATRNSARVGFATPAAYRAPAARKGTGGPLSCAAR